MNLLESVRSRVAIDSVLNHAGSGKVIAASEPSSSFWDCASKVAILALFYGAFFALKRRFWPCRRDAGCNTSCSREMRNHPAWCSSGDVCPICLEPPRHGVRTGCGHRICARCLRSYCKFHDDRTRKTCERRSSPPPCPLCRAPLVSISVTYDQPSDDDDDEHSSSARCSLDPETAGWIGEFNALYPSHGDDDYDVDDDGGVARRLVRWAAMIGCRLALIVSVVATIAGLQNVPLERVADRSCLVAALGMLLLACLWWGCHGRRAALDIGDD